MAIEWKSELANGTFCRAVCGPYSLNAFCDEWLIALDDGVDDAGPCCRGPANSIEEAKAAAVACLRRELKAMLAELGDE